MRILTALVMSLTLLSCTGDDTVLDDGWDVDDASEPEVTPADLPEIVDGEFGTTPDTYFPRPDFDSPSESSCVASTAADADYGCTVTFMPASGAIEITNLSFDRWGKLVRVAGEEIAEYEYDCDGNMIRSVSGTTAAQVVTEYVYEDGLLQQVRTTNERQGFESQVNYDYDEYGRTETMTSTVTDFDGESETETTQYEYDSEGGLARSESSEGTVFVYWTDGDGVEWYGDPGGDCEIGTLYDDHGNWIEQHTRCDAFGEGHRVTRMERDELRRPVQMTDPGGRVVETHSYQGANPYPASSWKEWVESSSGAETASFDYAYTLESMTVTAFNELSGDQAGTVTFDGVPCFPGEDGLRKGWLAALAIPEL